METVARMSTVHSSELVKPNGLNYAANNPRRSKKHEVIVTIIIVKSTSIIILRDIKEVHCFKKHAVHYGQAREKRLKLCNQRVMGRKMMAQAATQASN